MKLEWKKDERPFYGYDRLWLGNVPVAYITYKSGTRDDPSSSGHRVEMELPGIKAKSLPHKDMESAKQQGERLVVLWLQKSGLAGVESETVKQLSAALDFWMPDENLVEKAEEGMWDKHIKLLQEVGYF